jgi:phosphate-selective porin OprO and OprP
MNKYTIGLAMGLWFFTGPIGAYAEEPVSDLDRRLKVVEERLNQPQNFEAYWDEGFRLRTADKTFRLMIGGRIQSDWAFFSEEAEIREAFGELEHGTELRRARFFLRGEIYEFVEFKIEYDLTGGEPEPADVYIGIRRVPLLGTVRVGHQREPFHRLQGSSKYYIFMEKGLQNALAPSRNTGLRVINTVLDKRMTWSAGAYRETDSLGESSNEDSYNLTARLSGIPVFVEDGRILVHFAGAFSRKQMDEDTLDFDERPESHLAPRFVDTGDIPADGASLVGLESALVLGPVAVLAEYIRALVESVDGTNPTFSGYYITVAYMITGETRPYSRSTGQFSRMVPTRPFRSEGGGLGAWEVAARLSGIDLNDEAITGGELRDLSIALNWYLNSNTRVMLNYILADLDGVGKAHIVQSRFQIDI